MENKTTYYQKSLKHIKRNLNTYIPFAGLIFIIILFAILSRGLSVSTFNLRMLINQVTIISIIATGAVFIFSLGMLDISLGANVAVSTIIAGQVGILTNSVVLMLLTAIAVSMVISFLNGLSIAIFKLPAFIITLSMMQILIAFSKVLMAGRANFGIPSSLVLAYNTIEVKLLAVSVVIALGILLFNFTKIGRQNKILGGNAINAKLSGINAFRNIVFSFIISGFAIGVASFILITRTSTVSASSGSSYGFDVIVGLVLGGMAISGGPKSNIFAGIIGAAAITTLNNGLIIIGVGSGYIQIVRGVLFLTIVTVLAYKSRTKYLV